VAILYPVRLEGRQYERMANLGIIRTDLSDVLDYCREIERLLTDVGSGSQLVRAVWVVAIITYWRCFKSRQVRLNASEVFAADARLLELHRRIGVIRDKVIAHPTRLWEDSYVTVSVRSDEKGKCSVVSAKPNWGGLRVVHSAVDDLPILRALVPVAIARVDELSIEETANLSDSIERLAEHEIAQDRMPVARPFGDP